MREFVTVKGYGKLFIDKVIFESYFPIIFTCVNDKKELFLCVCCQNNENGCKWLVGKTNNYKIISMLQDKITIRDLLLESEGRITVDYINNKYIVSFDNSDWKEDSIFLPKKDSYLNVEPGEFDEEIAYYSSVDSIHYNEVFYKIISETEGSIAKTIDSVVDIQFDSTSVFNDMVISSEILLNTLKVSGILKKEENLTKDRYTNDKTFKSLYQNSCNTSDKIIMSEYETVNGDLIDAA